MTKNYFNAQYVQIKTCNLVRITSMSPNLFAEVVFPFSLIFLYKKIGKLVTIGVGGFTVIASENINRNRHIDANVRYERDINRNMHIDANIRNELNANRTQINVYIRNLNRMTKYCLHIGNEANRRPVQRILIVFTGFP